MTLAEKLFALRSAPGFERLHDAELAVIGAVALEHRFAPGEAVCEAGTTLSRVYVIVQGSLVASEGGTMPGIVGLGSVLFDIPVHTTVSASPTEGALCLVIFKPHMFTIVHQCPNLLCGLLEGEKLFV